MASDSRQRSRLPKDAKYIWFRMSGASLRSENQGFLGRSFRVQVSGTQKPAPT